MAIVVYAGSMGCNGGASELYTLVREVIGATVNRVAAGEARLSADLSSDLDVERMAELIGRDIVDAREYRVVNGVRFENGRSCSVGQVRICRVRAFQRGLEKAGLREQNGQ
jgi:hypothetical protein